MKWFDSSASKPFLYQLTLGWTGNVSDYSLRLSGTGCGNHAGFLFFSCWSMYTTSKYFGCLQLLRLSANTPYLPYLRSGHNWGEETLNKHLVWCKQEMLKLFSLLHHINTGWTWNTMWGILLEQVTLLMFCCNTGKHSPFVRSNVMREPHIHTHTFCLYSKHSCL